MLQAGSYMGRVPGMAHHTGGSMVGRLIRHGAMQRAVHVGGLGCDAVNAGGAALYGLGGLGTSLDMRAEVDADASDDGGGSFNWATALGFATVAADVATSIIDATTRSSSTASTARAPSTDPGLIAWQQSVQEQQRQTAQQMAQMNALVLAQSQRQQPAPGISSNTMMLIAGGGVALLAVVLLMKK